jgi:hypothetical protein
MMSRKAMRRGVEKTTKVEGFGALASGFKEDAVDAGGSDGS